MSTSIKDNTTALEALKTKAQSLPNKSDGSGGGTTTNGYDTSNADASPSDVLSPRIFYNAEGEQTGTMVDRGSLSITYTSNCSRSFNAGYYSGGTMTVNVPTSGGNNTDFSQVTAEPAEVKNGEYFYTSTGDLKQGTMPDATLNQPNITINNNGVITASASANTSGYISSGTSSSNTKTLSTLTTTPISVSGSYTVPAGTYLPNAVTFTASSSTSGSTSSSGMKLLTVESGGKVTIADSTVAIRADLSGNGVSGLVLPDIEQIYCIAADGDDLYGSLLDVFIDFANFNGFYTICDSSWANITKSGSDVYDASTIQIKNDELYITFPVDSITKCASQYKIYVYYMDETEDTGSSGSSNLPTVSVPTPTISIDSDGTITATVTQSAGATNGGTVSSEASLSSSYDADFISSNIKSGVTIFGVTGSYTGSGSSSSSTPTYSGAVTVTPDADGEVLYTSGKLMNSNITINGDSNLVAENIKSGVSIFGVTGTHEGGLSNIDKVSVTESSLVSSLTVQTNRSTIPSAIYIKNTNPPDALPNSSKSVLTRAVCDVYNESNYNDAPEVEITALDLDENITAYADNSTTPVESGNIFCSINGTTFEEHLAANFAIITTKSTNSSGKQVITITYTAAASNGITYSGDNACFWGIYDIYLIYD